MRADEIPSLKDFMISKSQTETKNEDDGVEMSGDHMKEYFSNQAQGK